MLSQPICKHCGGDHEIVAHDDDCPRHVFLMGDNDVQTQEEIDALPECICGDNVIGKNGYESVGVDCIDVATYC